MRVETVKIMPTHESQGAFVEISKTDFDPAKGHVPYEEAVKDQTLPLPFQAPPAPPAPAPQSQDGNTGAPAPAAPGPFAPPAPAAVSGP